MQLGRGEPIRDTGIVLGRYLDAIMIRANSHADVEELAAACGVPVINGLTDLHHPCQALADVLTLREWLGDLEGRRLAWVGDGHNNVCHSLLTAAGRIGHADRRRRAGGLRARPRCRCRRRRRAGDATIRARRWMVQMPSSPTCGRAWARSTSGSSA